ncbi:hypothetical protein ACO22_01616 [Paracoccidioides brasiliensis]|uniref:Uncharacterized protein n=1 Tax=Paracoccidioides brasiliensis TaxID=121759 RepID=A0A1D2JL48_PARBR|nr:hypothetical protein ACO22_01616 [Paracoccidioides brasiliensis]
MLTGRTLMIKVADNWQLDQPDDGWVESIPNLNIPITRESSNFQKCVKHSQEKGIIIVLSAAMIVEPGFGPTILDRS